jgi:hypothetical protein
MKKIAIAIVVLVAIVGLGAYFLLSNLDGLVKSTIENVGSELTGTAVSVDGVAIDLGSGSVSLQGLQIDNPVGYNSDYAFFLGEATVAIDTASLGGSVLLLKEIVVKGARLNAEQRGNSNNLSDLLKQLEANSSKGKGAEEQQAPPPEDDSDPARLAVKRFVFANTRATLISEVEEPREIKVPDVRRKNIGNPKTGLTPEELGNVLLQAVLEEVQAAVVDELAELAKDAAKDKIMEKIGFPKKG